MIKKDLIKDNVYVELSKKPYAIFNVDGGYI